MKKLRVEVAASRLVYCLDFANTLQNRGSELPVEGLNSYADLVEWLQRNDLIDAEQGLYLEQQAVLRSEEAAQILREAIDLREVIYRLFSTQIYNRTATPSDIAALNLANRRALAHAKLRASEVGLQRDWSFENDSLDAGLWPIIDSAVVLLTTPELLARVGKCADDKCGYLFLDLSRNRSRRWCDISDCGNRAKQRRYYHRSKRHQPAD